MDMLKVMLSRRSVRTFDRDKPVESWKKDAVITAATSAPSAKNLRPVRFLVLDDREILDDLGNVLSQGKPFKECDFAVAVCADLSDYPDGSLGWLEDCSAALENMLIEATSLDLASFWFGVYRRDPKEGQVRSVLEVPSHVEVQGIGVFGYGAESVPAREGVDSSVVRYGRWGDFKA